MRAARFILDPGACLILLTGLLLLALPTLAGEPEWWRVEYVGIDSVINDQLPSNNKGPANQGQVKNLANKARELMDMYWDDPMHIYGWDDPGAGDVIDALVDGFTQDHNKNLVNVGQVKNTAKPFYQRLVDLGFIDDDPPWPWTDDGADDVNNAPANVGQVKNAFSFEIPVPEEILMPIGYGWTKATVNTNLNLPSGTPTGNKRWIVIPFDPENGAAFANNGTERGGMEMIERWYDGDDTGVWMTPGTEVRSYVLLVYDENIPAEVMMGRFNVVEVESAMVRIKDVRDRNGAMSGDTLIMKGSMVHDLGTGTWDVDTTIAHGDSPVKVSDIVPLPNDEYAVFVDEDSGDGIVNLRYYCEEVTNAHVIVSMTIGDACGGCSGCLPGMGKASLSGSLTFEMDMGAAEDGKRAGKIRLHAETIASAPFIGSPQGLDLSGLDPTQVTILRTPGGTVRQIATDQCLADIIREAPGDTHKYRVNFYGPEDMGTEPEEGEFYTPTGPSYLSYQIWHTDHDGNNPGGNEVFITRNYGGTATPYHYRYDPTADSWQLTTAGARRETKDIYGTVGEGHTEVVTISTEAETPVVVAAHQNTFEQFAWGEELVSRTDYTDDADLVTSYIYYEDSVASGAYESKLQAVVNPDGSWVMYKYDSDGRPWRVSAPLKDQAFFQQEGPVVTEYSYIPVVPGDTGDITDSREARTVTKSISGDVVEKTFYGYLTVSGERVMIVERAATATASYGDAGNLQTKTTYYSSGAAEAEAGRVKKVEYPDGRVDNYSYEYGVYTVVPGAPENNSFAAGGAETALATYVTQVTATSPNGLANTTTRSVNIQDRLGRAIHSETHVYTGTGYERLNWTYNKLDELGRVLETHGSDGSLVTTTWGCCGKDSEISATGVEISYGYDVLDRLDTVTRQTAGNPIITDYTYDAAGRTTGVETRSGALSLSSSTEYDLVGRVTRSTDQAGLVTTYLYENGGRKVTVTAPSGATQITENHIDGRTKSVTGTGVTARHYDYGVNGNGTQWTRVHSGPGGLSSPMWVVTTTDFLGRTERQEQPAYGAGTLTTLNTYNNIGQLVKTERPAQATTLYEYDELGRQYRSGLDLNNDGDLDLDGDRVSESDSRYAKDDSDDWWAVSVSKTYPSESSATPVTLNTTSNRITGLSMALASERRSYDIHGNEVISSSAINRSGKTVTQTIDYPDSDTDAVSVTVNGLLQSTTTKTGLQYTYGHDDLGRRITVTDPRTGAAETHYNAKGQVDWFEDAAGKRKTYTYDPTSGRQIAVENALGKFTRYEYDSKGQLIRTWGDEPNPASYEYDAYGRMKKMHTYRGAPTSGNWNDTTWPTPGTADTTEWVYDADTGLMTQKKYADGHGPTYTYTADGKLLTRAWARGVTTTYSYDPNHGALTGIDYSDSTPDVSFTYDRMGRKKTVQDGQGTRTFVYDPSTLALATETIPGVFEIEREYQDGMEQNGLPGRYAGIKLDVGADASTEYQVTYGFTAQGRFGTLTWDVGGATRTATYGYVPSSHLIAGYSVPLDAGGPLSISKAYESSRDLIDYVENVADATVVSRYDYENDEIGRRTDVQYSGSAFAGTAENVFGYNDRSELTGALMGQVNYAYGYDNIGNRETSSQDSMQLTYTANELNQYLNVSGPGSFDLEYDADGNMTSSDRPGPPTETYVNEWDAENRLISVAPAEPSNRDIRVVFAYDYMGRRISKEIYKYKKTWNLDSTIRFLYDGWNMISAKTTVEKTGSTTLDYYVCGLDLSGSLQGAGGVGGLVSWVRDGVEQLYTYDGNGNVGQLIGMTGGFAGKYEYDAFGNTVYKWGIPANVNPFRFSTKYFDKETDLYYYGFRYYQPQTGRWLSRDPIGEQGGINLYGFVGNDGINAVDRLGLIDLEFAELSKSKYRSFIEKRIRAGISDMDTLWKEALQHYLDNDPEGDLCWSCVADMGNIIGAFANIFGDNDSPYNHGGPVTVGVHDSDGSAITHFFAGADWEAMLEIGDTMQDLFESWSEIRWVAGGPPAGNDKWFDTAYAYAGADLADYFDTWRDRTCRKRVREFTSGQRKFTSFFMGPTPAANTEQGVKQFRAALKKRLDAAIKAQKPKNKKVSK